MMLSGFRHISRQMISHNTQSRGFRVVLALGGNAILRRGEDLTTENQGRALEKAAHEIARLMRCKNKLIDKDDPQGCKFPEIILTHGNGPQVGLLALQTSACENVPPAPLDVLGAETEGMIGYQLEQALRNEQPYGKFATLLTQVVVSPDDLQHPSKPIGPIYSQKEAMQIQLQHPLWTIKPEGSHFRRKVPSPEPLKILEIDTIKLLVDHGVTVICAGGGGIPVMQDPTDIGHYHGVEAVVDKDLASSLLALALDADALIMLTDVSGVFEHYRMPGERVLSSMHAKTVDIDEYEEGSMRPKVEAAMRFVNAGHGGYRQRPRFSCIGSLDNLFDVVRKRAGTTLF